MFSITMSYSHIFALDLYCILDKKKALGKTAVALEQKKLAEIERENSNLSDMRVRAQWPNMRYTHGQRRIGKKEIEG